MQRLIYCTCAACLTSRLRACLVQRFALLLYIIHAAGCDVTSYRTNVAMTIDDGAVSSFSKSSRIATFQRRAHLAAVARLPAMLLRVCAYRGPKKAAVRRRFDISPRSERAQRRRRCFAASFLFMLD